MSLPTTSKPACRSAVASNNAVHMVDPARIPHTAVQVFLREMSAEAPLDAAEAQERFDLLKQWKKIGLPGVAGDGNGFRLGDGRPNLVAKHRPPLCLPVAVIACPICPSHFCFPCLALLDATILPLLHAGSQILPMHSGRCGIIASVPMPGFR